MSTPRQYGWKRPSAEHRVPRQFLLAASHLNLPSKIDLRLHCPGIYDQMSLGACTANSLASLAEFLLKRDGLPDFMPSRLAIYYGERSLEGTVKRDAGASLSDGIKVLATQGCFPEALWPYDVKKFATKPPTPSPSTIRKIANYWSFDNGVLDNLRQVLAYNVPFVFGFQVFESFEGPEIAKTGVMPMPAEGENVLGGHAVSAVGYDDARKVFIVRNSWGPDWGDKGHFYMPYAFITSTKFCDDFWTAHHIH